MFGDFSPSVRNLLTRPNEWRNRNTYLLTNLGTDPDSWIRYRNTTPAATGAQQVSPATEWEGQGFKTSGGGGSQKVKFRAYVLPIQGTNNPLGRFKLQYSINDAAYSDAIDWDTKYQDGVTTPKMYSYSILELQASLSNQDPNTSTSLYLTNPSGTYTNVSFKFGSTIKSAFTVDSLGITSFKQVNNGTGYMFMSGGSISSQSIMVQIYGVGNIYANGGGFYGGRVTAGSAVTSPPAILNSFGSTALKGQRITAATYTLAATETLVYGDADSANLCSGTPSACSSYTGSGQATCETHVAVGCSWFAGNNCNAANGTDSGTCTAQDASCVWDETTCSGANNTDQGTCESQDDTYGGSCAWETSTCPSQTSTAACNAITGCTADVSGDCGTLSDAGGDGTACATQPECSYDNGTGVCSGTFFVSCSGNLCTGNYFVGTCSGIYGAECQGTADCANLTDDGSVVCAAEAGCSWVSGATYTLPSSTSINNGNTATAYFIWNLGSVGNISVIASSGDTMNTAITLTPGQKAMVHHHYNQQNCSDFTSVGTCTPTGCSWTSKVCGDNADETACNLDSGNGCSWNGGSFICEGTYTGTAGTCSGTYYVFKKWFRWI